MDATRISDGAYVALKSIQPSVHPYEIEIGTYLSSESLASNPKNHCVPIYEVLDVSDVDDMVILVMPLLRKYNQPPLQTFGESVDFFQQIFEVCGLIFSFLLTPLTRDLKGLQFMHNHRVAHRSVTSILSSCIVLNARPIYPIATA
jgi:serine/threonine protein kinase